MKQNKTFALIGITGGAGSGKSTVVENIKELIPTEFLHCDVIAHELMQPGGASYAALIKEFGQAILEESEAGCEETGTQVPISRQNLARIAMATPESRARLNAVTHPLVRQEVDARIAALSEAGFAGVVVIEAALLLEAGYKELCDAVWYVHAPKEDRIRRMKENRGYTEEKIEHILAGQLTEEQFLAQTDVVIENPDMEAESQKEFIKKQIMHHLNKQLESKGRV